jgi:hypothetical protein
MRTSRFSEEQIRYAVQRAEAGIGGAISVATMAQARFYRWALADHLSISLVD